MKDLKNKKIIYFLIIIFIFFIVFFLNNKKTEEKNEIDVLPISVAENQEISSISIDKSLSFSKEEEEDLIISLIVEGSMYQTSFIEGNTVFDIMKNLESEDDSNFTFKYKEYPSLGIFIDEINGIKGESGKYWIYYINDKEASVGVSKNFISRGDIINWKLK